MNQYSIADLRPGMVFQGFLLVRSSELRKDKKGNPMVNLNLADKSGELSAINWNSGATVFDVGSIVLVRGLLNDFNGRLQLKVDMIRQSVPTDDVDMTAIIPAAPRSAKEMTDEILNCVEQFESATLKSVTSALLSEYADKLSYYPAAQRIHHAEMGGLLHHTTSMLQAAKGMAEVYPILNKDLLFAGVILHDLCKMDELDSDRYGVVRDYTRNGLLLGHLVMGVTRIQQAADRLGLADEEEVVLLQHMILSHHGETEYGSPKAPMFLEAEMLHWLDMIDARINDMQTNQEKVSPGSFTEKIWSLDRRVYRPATGSPEAPKPLCDEDKGQSAYL